MVTLPGRDIVVVAASAGGLEPLRTMLAALPADLPASVLVVMHVSAASGDALPRILDRAGPLPAAAAADGEKIKPGRVYVAPPDRHLLIVNDVARLSRGPRQNGFRPAADPLFRSAALHCGPRTTAVVLSGALDDGALGCATVEERGGCAVVQDPADADYADMPRSALTCTGHAMIRPASGLAELVTRLAGEEVDVPVSEPSDELAAEVRGLLAGDLETNTFTRTYSGLTCPECGGPLYSAHEGKAETYDCLVGHRWSERSLFEGQSDSAERALWLAIRSLEERARLTGRLAEATRERGNPLSAGRFADAAREAQQSADAIRRIAVRMTAIADGPDDDALGQKARVTDNGDR